MSSQRVITVCKYNQARSITAAAALRRFFPEIEILSAGIQANPLLPTPSSILEILDQWGLDQYDNRSTPVTNLPTLQATDLVLCADAEVKATLIKQLNITNPNDYKIRVLEEYAVSSLEIPVDPVNMGESDTKMQLARAVVLSVRAVRKELQIQHPIASARFPHDKAEHMRIQREMITAVENNHGTIIDAGFSIPNPLLWQVNNLGFIAINPNRLEIDSGVQKQSGILISKFEVDFVPKIFLSINYLAWLQDIAVQQNIYLLAQPAEGLPPARHHEAILALIHS